MKIIWGDWYDSDTKMLKLLWEGIPNVNLVHLTKKWKRVMDKAVELAVSDEKDTLLICGHGTQHGLLVPHSFTEYAVHQMNVGLIQAKRVVGIMCYGAEFAKNVGLHGLFSSMFISNVNEAVDYSIFTTRERIHETNALILGIVNEYLADKITLDECLKKLQCERSLNEVSEFNVSGMQIV